ncbi:sulfatase-like hydrolase/transferase [Anaerorhabdus sp.]|uniref:sulfatase-like hydrolase/transferase n=1 Tax=Anaerorhabdus sp. TaxID=1872524 RepID=UPI002FC79E7B
MTKPNVIFILNDHQAFYRHGWDGGVKPLRPNFEKFASEGAEFTNAYCATPLCAPVRRTMLNGQFAHKHKNYYNTSSAPYDEETYLEALFKEGYKNYYFGKWHAGADNATTIENQHCEGFSCDGYGNPYTSETYKKYLERYNLPMAEHFIEWHCCSDRLFAEGHFPKIKVGENYKCESSWCGEHAMGITVTPKETHESFFLANLACEKLEELVKNGSDEPFNMRVDFWGPHQPFFPTKEFYDMYNPKDIKEYGNFSDDLNNRADVHRTEDNRFIGDDNQKIIHPNPVPWETWQEILAHAYAHNTMLDAAAGKILDKVKELGLDKNTVIVWATDHGDALASHGGHFDKCSYMSQEVMRIPMAIKWPGVIDPNQKFNQLVSNMDIPVTIMDAVGLKFKQEYHGSSLLPLVKHETKEWRDDLMCETAGHGYVERINGRMMVHDNYKLVKFENQIDELYDLDKDPFELNNLAQDENYKDIKHDLLKRLRTWQAKTNDADMIC